ncbi:unnamed protein product [Cyclocybe aegerita]|uniref:Uncharacterized protein n=1 Tax=Cyclocybe aegerita TaxID=1973307 RepID=A0A8S0W6M5_CYCAE|nr:unnamed protein product [Cyclocybe aegerita]
MSTFLERVQGGENARILSIALLALTVYEYAITLDDEKKYFWKGPYSVSHSLFFFNRYFPPVVVILAVVCFMLLSSSPDNLFVQFCKTTIQLNFLFGLLAIGVIQVILITRIWFLFPGDALVRSVLTMGFVVATGTSFAFLYISVKQIPVFPPRQNPNVFIPGCVASIPPQFWRVYLPSLVLHLLLYSLTIHQALTNDDFKKQKNLRKRLLEDGGVFCLIVLLSVGFSSVGSFLTDVPQLNIPSIFSPVIVTCTSLATTRIMFSLRAITIDVGSDFEWLPTPTPMTATTLKPLFITYPKGVPVALVSESPMTPYEKGHLTSTWSPMSLQTGQAEKSFMPQIYDEERGLGVKQALGRSVPFSRTFVSTITATVNHPPANLDPPHYQQPNIMAAYNSYTPEQALYKIQQALQDTCEELFDHKFFKEVDNGHYAEQTFGPYLPSDAEITGFLDSAGVYCKQLELWHGGHLVPRSAIQVFQSIFDAVIKYFGCTERQVHRVHDELVQVHLQTIAEAPKLPIVLSTAPQIVVAGTDANFPPRNIDPEVERVDWDFIRSNAAGICMIKWEDELELCLDKIILEAAYFARQAFIASSNRVFIHILVIAGRKAKMLLFDREGCLMSRSFQNNDASGAKELVRCILLLCSRETQLLGFDASVHWHQDCRYIRTRDAEGKAIYYRLLKPYPIFQHENIRCKGTTCYQAEGPNGDICVLKDAWKDRGSPLEKEMLGFTKDAKVQGVGEMVGSEVGWGLRNIREPFTHEVRDLVQLRITLKGYGKSIDNFESRKQLLYAFRDAVAGHRNLWRAGALHRDISANNILLGNHHAPEGWRGVLIDLEFAVRLRYHDILPRASDKTGTPAFLSTKILHCQTPGSPWDPPKTHTYVDDLWAFLYVMYWICFSFRAPHEIVTPLPQILKDFDATDAALAIRAKEWLFIDGIKALDTFVTPFFGDVFRRLILALQDFLLLAESSLADPGLAGPTGDIRKGCLYNISEDHYEEFLAIVDRATADLEKETRRGSEVAAEVSVPASHGVGPEAEARQEAPLAPISLNRPHGIRRNREIGDGDDENNGPRTRRVKQAHRPWEL